MQDHLDRDALERLVHRRCHASRAYGWLLHLLGCAECRERVARNYPGKGERFLREIFHTQEPLRPPDLENRDRLDRVLEDLQTHGLLEYLQEGDVPPLLADLDRHPPERQRLILENTERLWNLATVEHLFARCEKEVHRDPGYGQHLAEMALSLLDRLSPDHYHPTLLNDLKGRGWGLRANFLRICEGLAAASEDLERAAAFFDSGTGDSDNEIFLATFQAAISYSRYEYETAANFHRRVLELSRESGNQQAEICSVVTLVQTLPEFGQYQEALRLGEEYLEQISIERDGKNMLLALQSNLALTMSYMGRGLPAYRLQQDVLRNLPADQPRLITKACWLQVHIFESLGDYLAADEALEAVTNSVVEYLSRHDLGALLTDRARLALRRGDLPLAQKYGREACHIFEQAGSHPLAQAIRRMLAGGPLIRL
jgi:tetratricopeptide (TPR) repeat protein